MTARVVPFPRREGAPVDSRPAIVVDLEAHFTTAQRLADLLRGAPVDGEARLGAEVLASQAEELLERARRGAL